MRMEPSAQIPIVDGALAAALAAGDAPSAITRLAALAPAWYREARHAMLCAACEQVAVLDPAQPLPDELALWRALATWYVAPVQALAQLEALALRRGLGLHQPPAPQPRLGDDLFLLAALFRSEFATLAGLERLVPRMALLDAHLAAPDRAAAPALCQLGGLAASLAWRALTGAPAEEQAALGAECLALVPKLADRHSLCSVVALARWPLLRGDMAVARETCELITVGLLAGDDAQMPLAHGWLMAVQAALARPGDFDLLRAWQDGSMDREALLDSPIAPTLLVALALLEARAPQAAAPDLAALVLARQERWPALERWLARAARAWAHLRDEDVPAARAVLRLLAADAPPNTLLGTTLQLLQAQASWLAGDPLPTLPAPESLHARGWSGPALLCQLLAWADAGHAVSLEALERVEATWRRQALALPLFTAPALARQVLARLHAEGLQAAAPGWLGAAARPLQGASVSAPPPVQVRLCDGLAIRVDGQPLAWGRKPPRRLLELAALLALEAPTELPVHRLADALYPELDGDAARRALDTALYRLRRLLPPSALRRGAIGVALDPAVVQVDRSGPRERWLPEFEQAWAERARGATATVRPG